MESWMKLDESWNDVTDIIVYGFGRVARRNINKLQNDFNILFVIDNNIGSRKEAEKKGINALSLNEAGNMLRGNKIIVATSSLAYESIKDGLMTIGLYENVDFCRLESFMVEWYWKNKQQLCISQINSAITTRCTFKCKYCSNLMPYFHQHFEYGVEEIRNDLEALFTKVDYVASFYLLGGEPLLNKELPNIVAMIGENYFDRIGHLQIVTNGSIVPTDKLIEQCKRYGVNVRVSDYTRKIPYERVYNNTIQKLIDNEVDYSVSDYSTWMNIGFPEEVCIKGDIKEHMQACSQGCHSLNDGKFFYCGVIWDAWKSGLYDVKSGDYIDLLSDEIEKIDVLKYCLGVQDGYIELCQKCRGFGKDNDCLVEVAEQKGM